jgi:2-methylisocitrate lyase-like PEP mutase family enzyme
MDHWITIMGTSIEQKVIRFRALHAAPGAFVIPNPWDVGSARVLAGLGFEALATSSAASAWTLGRRDYAVSREEALAMAKAIVDAVDIPVSGDLENGFGDDPEACALTIRAAGGIGLAGGSIEDAAGNAAPYELSHAVARVAAAVTAARSLPAGFVLTARAENYLRGKPDLADTIKRLQAYEAAGADVLAAPGLPDLAAVRAVCAAVTKPVNFMGGAKGKSFSVAELAAAGVKRVSVATTLHRAAFTALRDVATELRERGTFSFADELLTSADVAAYMR